VRLRLIAFVAVIAVAVPAVALGSSTKTLEFEAYLTGKNEVPSGAAKGAGTVNLKITGSKVCWKFTKLKGFGTPLVAHIHKGKAGKSGPVYIPLGGAFKASGCFKAPASSPTAAIAKNPKGFYVNIHTKQFPNGAVRGQLHAGD
jgi:CHRD domain